jgi:hypothetical protein
MLAGLACGGEKGVSTPAITPAPATVATATATAPSPSSTRAVTTAPTSTPGSFSGPVLQVDEPDRLRIPKIGVDAPLVLRTVGKDGVMPNPGRDEVAIYDFSQFAGLGGVPGKGNAVVSAFAGLTGLQVGDEVQVVWRRQLYVYGVVSFCLASTRDFEKVIATTPQEVLTLLPLVPDDPRPFVRAARVGSSASGACPAGTTSAPR